MHLYVEAYKKHNKQNRNRPIGTENRLTAIRGERGLRADGKDGAIKQRKILIDIDNSMVITRGEGHWRSRRD